MTLETPVYPVQIEWEFEKLLEIYVERKPKKVLEIGVKDGGTLYHWLRLATPRTTVVAVDFEVKYDPSWIPDQVGIIPISGDSHDPEIIKQVRFNGPYDWVFIDGDHSYKGVHKDFFTYGHSPVVVLHDICPDPDDKECEVAEFWDDLKVIFQYHYYKFEEIIKDRNQHECGIGILYR